MSDRMIGQPPYYCVYSGKDDDGVLRHSGKAVWTKACDGTIVAVCWKHRKFYRGWRSKLSVVTDSQKLAARKEE